VKAVII